MEFSGDANLGAFLSSAHFILGIGNGDEADTNVGVKCLGNAPEKWQYQSIGGELGRSSGKDERT